jgi:hypothetical protein
MVKGCRHLDQCLQKALFRFVQSEPDQLPMFVCREEFRSFEAGKALGERAAIPVKVHTSRICDGSCAWLAFTVLR